jgi:hypothetical protein
MYHITVHDLNDPRFKWWVAWIVCGSGFTILYCSQSMLQVDVLATIQFQIPPFGLCHWGIATNWVNNFPPQVTYGK